DEARGYDCVEGSSHYLVPLPREFLLVERSGLQHCGMRHVGGLLRNYLLANEFLVAYVGNVLNPIERPRIRYLLVRLRRFDDRDNLSSRYVIALIYIDGLHVSGDLCVNRSFDVAVNGRW